MDTNNTASKGRRSARLSGRYVISYGLDGTTGNPVATADDMCDALAQMERLLGGRENAMRLTLINRGNGVFIYNFVHLGKSAWMKCYSEGRLPHAAELEQFVGVEMHRENAVFV